MTNNIRVSRLLTLATAALGMFFTAAVSSPLKAEPVDGVAATVTFDQPVELPGRVLPPGSYVFKSTENDDLVQVFSADQKHLFATLSVIPADRPLQGQASDSFIQLNKSRADAPQEVEGFFVAGRQTGFQFVYPVVQTRRRRG